jgi:uncharacterized protein (DUF1810 family)
VAALSWLWRGAARDVFGDTDANKLEASLALFDEVTGDPLIGAMLALWFDRPGQDLVAGLAIPS